tara:strand:+ start:581 stop:862 length:282 start_codon:yes stop_codon:yes gene_type:complete
MHGNLEPEEKVFGMNVIVYSSHGCFYCEQMKLLMEKANLTYKEIEVDVTNRASFIKKYPDAKGYPYVIIDGKPIGGLVETAKELLKKGLIHAR